MVGKNLPQLLGRFETLLRVHDRASGNINGAGNVAGLQIQIFLPAGKPIGFPRINEQPGVGLHVLDGGGGHVTGAGSNIVVDAGVTRAGSHRVVPARPLLLPTVEDAHIAHARPFQCPPGACGKKPPLVVVNNNLVGVVKPPIFKPPLQDGFGGQGVAAFGCAGNVGEGQCGVAEPGGGNVSRLEMLVVTVLVRLP